MAFWGFLLAWVGSALLGSLLRPKPEVSHARPRGFEEFQFPTVSESRPLSVLFGRRMIRGANILWWGNYRIVPIWTSTTMKTGLFGKKKTVSQITGWRYSFTIHLGLGHAGLDAVRRLDVGGKTAWTGTLGPAGAVAVIQPNLFGGLDKEGGLTGTLYLMSGTQGAPNGTFRGYQLGTVATWDGEIGTSPYPREFSLEGERFPDLLGLGAVGGTDANPAEILLESTIDPTGRWGGRVPEEMVDDATFLAAGETLETEGFGLSLNWDQRKKVSEFQDEILKTIDGILEEDPQTGKLFLELVRDPGDPEALPEVGPEMIVRVQASTTQAQDDNVNEVRVTFPNRARDYLDSTVVAHNTAGYVAQGRHPVAREIRFEGVVNETLAQQLAWRELTNLTTPLYQGTYVLTRAAWWMRKNSVFRLRCPEEGIQSMVVRVVKVQGGSLTNGEVTVDLIQDVFSLGSALTTAPAASEWTSPVDAPEDLEVVDLDEVPLQWLRTEDMEAMLGDPSPRLDFRAHRDSGSVYAIQADTRVGGGAEWDLDRAMQDGMAPSAVLAVAYPQGAGDGVLEEGGALLVEDAMGFDLLDAATDGEVLAGSANLAYLGSELIAFRTATDLGGGSWRLDGVYRGLWDTVPVDHEVGELVHVWSYGRTISLDAFALGNDARARLIPTTARGPLDREEATEHQRTVTDRRARPYPPGNTRMNGVLVPEPVHLPDGPGDPQSAVLTGPMVATWAHRDRMAQIEGATRQDAGSVGPEAGTTYTVRIRDEDGVLRHTETGVSGTSYTWPLATELAESGKLNEEISYELESVRDGLASHQFQARVGHFGGHGMRHGENHGGAG